MTAADLLELTMSATNDHSRDVHLEPDELAQLCGLEPGFVSNVTDVRGAAAKDGDSGHYARRNRGTDPSVAVARRLASSPTTLRLVRDAIDGHASLSELARIRRQLLDR